MAKRIRQLRDQKYWKKSYSYQQLDDLKKELCDLLYIRTTASCISLVYQRHTEKLSLTQLFNYLAIAEPSFRVLVAI
jgi:hypothetical protein